MDTPRTPLSDQPDPVERQVRESVLSRVGLVCLIAWVVLTFALVVPLQFAGRARAPQIILTGFGVLFVLLMVASLAYHRMVEARLRRARAKKGEQ